MDKVDVISKLLELWSKTPKHIDGSILGSMTTWPHELAVYAYTLFIHTNLADPVIFRSIAYFEQEVVKEVASYLDSSDASGFITSGGTESNIIALYTAREYGLKNGLNNIVVAPVTAHASIDKACRLLGTRLVKMSVNRNYVVEPSTVEEYTRKYKPYAVVLTAGTTDFGTVDPYKAVSEIAIKYNIWVHVDAAYGGLLIPFIWWKRGLDKLKFYDGIHSVSLDFHKNGFVPPPAGIILFRESRLEKTAYFNVPYMPSKYQKGLLGTRPGGVAAAIWTVLKVLGYNGFKEIAEKIIEVADYTYKVILETKFFTPIIKPVLGIVSFTTSKSYKVDPETLLNMLWRRNIYLYRTSLVEGLRIVVMPHVTKKHIDRFIEVASKIFREV